MFEFILGIFIGAVVMDFFWASKFGIPQILWKQFCFSIKKLINHLRLQRFFK